MVQKLTIAMIFWPPVSVDEGSFLPPNSHFLHEYHFIQVFNKNVKKATILEAVWSGVPLIFKGKVKPFCEVEYVCMKQNANFR